MARGRTFNGLIQIAASAFAILASAVGCSTPDRGPASLPPCLQAPGLNSTLMFGDDEPFCPIDFKAQERDIAILNKHISELDQRYKSANAEGDPSAESSLYFGFQRKYQFSKKKKPFSALSKHEVFALFDYIEWGYQTFNRALWSEQSNNPLERGEIRLLTSALNKLPSYRGRVYRGEIDPFVQEDMNDLNDRIASLIPGQPYLFKGFMSTTLAKNAQGKAYRENRVIVYEVKSKHGKNVAPLSSRLEENEILFRPGTWFQVLDLRKIPKKRSDRYPLDYQWYVKLEEL